MKIAQLTETTAGATASGSVAPVAQPLMKTQAREDKPAKAPKVVKGKKYSNTIREGKMKAIDTDMKELSDAAFKKKYGRSKEEMKKRLKEDEIVEQDLIIVPGMRKSKDSSFIPREKDRRDHEVEMARSDLYAAAKDAMRLYQLLQNRTEDEGLMGWQQSYITLAADYLNSVADSIEHDSKMNEISGGVIAGGIAAEDKHNVPTKVRNMLDAIVLLRTQEKTALERGRKQEAQAIRQKRAELEDQVYTYPKGDAYMSLFRKELLSTDDRE